MRARGLIAAALGLLAGGVGAQTLLIGGTQLSSQSQYSYLGVIVPREGVKLGDGWFQRSVVSWLGYRYDTTQDGNPVEVRANAPGIDTGIGYAWTGDGWRGDASLAVGLRHTRLRPDVETDGPKGTRLTLTPQLATRYQFAPTLDVDALGAYSFGTRDRFLRVQAGWQPAGRVWRTGLVGSLAQGPEYREVRRGLFVGWPVAAGWFLELDAGRARPRDGHHGGYGGISVSWLP